jgi:hypothetical protein
MLFETTSDIISAATDALLLSDKSSNSCGGNNSGYAWVWMTVVPIGFYSALSVYSNAVECYNFVVAWNMISRTHRMELELVHFRTNAAVERRKSIEMILYTRPYRDVFFPKEASCPVCLFDYKPSDAVSSCYDQNYHRSKNRPCCHMFHEECLTSWLQGHSNCPCCRHEILPLPKAPSQHLALLIPAARSST